MSAKANAIKASLALFAPTYNRLPLIQSTTNNLKQAIKGRFDMFSLGNTHFNQIWQQEPSIWAN